MVNIEDALKLLFPGATEQQLRDAKFEVAQVWNIRLADGIRRAR